MARIQNPQNEKGELLATDNKVQELITKRLVPLEDSFRNISNDQFIKVEKGEPDTENNYFKTKISANYTDDINDINADTIEKENNKLVTSKLLKDVKDKLNANIKSSVSKLEKAVETEINDRIEADAELATKIEERFELLSDELEKHIENSNDLSISGDDFINSEKTDTSWNLTLNSSTDLSSSDTDGDKKVPTVNAVSKVAYKDFTVNNFEEENNNYGDTYGFIIDENIIGILRNVKVKCMTWNKPSDTYLKILNENNEIIGCSKESQEHGANNELSFTFDEVTLEKDKSYKAVFSSSNALNQLDKTAGCLRVNYEGDINFTAAGLYTPILNSDLELALNAQTSLKSYAIVEFTYKTSAADLSNIVYDNLKTHVNDRVKHIFTDEYVHDDTNYNNVWTVITSLGYGFVWKPEASAHISSIEMILKAESEIYIYNPGNLTDSLLKSNPETPYLNFYVNITDSSNNKLIDTSKLVEIEYGAKNKESVKIEFNKLVPCVKNKTYYVTFHSSAESAEKNLPDIALPIYISFYEDEAGPITNDYTIKKLIIDSNKSEYYTEGKINSVTLNDKGQDPMSDIYLQNLCVKINTTRYTHPELNHIADAIGDIWEYLASIKTYISSL